MRSVIDDARDSRMVRLGDPAEPGFRRVGWTLLLAVGLSALAWVAIIFAGIGIVEGLVSRS